MTQIKAFKAVHYNPQKVEDISQVVCPPYDVISPEDQLKFHQAHPNNFIHILLGLDKPGDDNHSNRYTRARELFDEWQAKGVLVEDDRPCFYIYKQEYMLFGQRRSRIGFLGLMKLEDKGESKVYPHENTHMAAKVDRLRLLRNVKAKLSPIFVCYSDKYRKTETIFYDFIASHKPFMEALDNDGIRHILWRMDEPSLIEKVREFMADQPLFIADGHHRYEAACEYKQLRIKTKQKLTGKEGFYYIMTYFTNLDSKDLVVLPIHRVIKKFPVKLDFLEDFFRIDKIKSMNELKILLGRAGQNEHAFGLYTREGISLLRLKSRLLIDQHIKGGSSEYRSLDATILQRLILDRMKIPTEHIIYKKDLEDAVAMINDEKAAACFVMNPVRVEQIKAVALNGEKMPPKTTYFYPKVLSGLTVHKMN